MLTSSILSLAEMCELFGTSPRTVRRWLDKGLPASQPAGPGGKIFFLRDDVEAWLRQQRANPPVRRLRKTRSKSGGRRV